MLGVDFHLFDDVVGGMMESAFAIVIVNMILVLMIMFILRLRIMTWCSYAPTFSGNLKSVC